MSEENSKPPGLDTTLQSLTAELRAIGAQPSRREHAYEEPRATCPPSSPARPALVQPTISAAVPKPSLSRSQTSRATSQARRYQTRQPSKTRPAYTPDNSAAQTKFAQAKAEIFRRMEEEIAAEMEESARRISTITNQHWRELMALILGQIWA